MDKQDVINQEYANALDMAHPHVYMRPKLFIDGGQYCALYGDDIHNGCAGFGDTAQLAMEDFDRQWYCTKAPKPKRDDVMVTALVTARAALVELERHLDIVYGAGSWARKYRATCALTAKARAAVDAAWDGRGQRCTVI